MPIFNVSTPTFPSAKPSARQITLPAIPSFPQMPQSGSESILGLGQQGFLGPTQGQQMIAYYMLPNLFDTMMTKKQNQGSQAKQSSQTNQSSASNAASTSAPATTTNQSAEVALPHTNVTTTTTPSAKTNSQSYSKTSLEKMAADAANKHGVDPSIFLAQIDQESGFNPEAKSEAGAIGIAQFMPGTAQGMGIDPTNPAQALDGAARLMASYLKQYNGDYSLALAAYNAGPGNVQKYGGVPPFNETQTYIRNILGNAKHEALTLGQYLDNVRQTGVIGGS